MRIVRIHAVASIPTAGATVKPVTYNPAAPARITAPGHEGSPMSSEKDRDDYFADPDRKPFDFKFTAEVAGVFDDMVSRSVPFYH
jgi:hypothetical protein